MTQTVRISVVRAACFLLACSWAVSARADGPTLKAVFGLAGCYRPGTWCPVTVTVQNPGSDALTGQVQVLAATDPGRPNYGGQGGNLALTGALFARPASVPSGSGSIVVYTRGINPGSDSVTVQFAEGRERGDGRVLAQTTNQPTLTTPTVTGIPITDTDLFLVGFGGDPGVFTYLRGQKLGLIHVASGGTAPVGVLPSPNLPNGGSAGAAQVAAAGAADLPDKSAGYSGVDAVLLRSDAPLDALTEAQEDALKSWVAGGGHLIVCGGLDPSRFASSFFHGLLPATIGAANPTLTLPGAGVVGGLTLMPKPLPGVRVIAGAISGPYGAGRVTMTAYDPTTKALQSSDAMQGIWQTLLTDGHASHPSVLTHVAAREENYNANPYNSYNPYGNGGGPLMSEAVMRAPSLDAPGTGVIGLFLLVYLVALVPVNYLILKRLDRKELAWVTIPLVVLIFAVGTYGVGYAVKGGAVFVNRAAIVETTSGQREAGVYAELGLFSPHRTSYDITIPGANALAAIPNPGFNYGYRNNGNEAETQSYGQTRFVELGEGASLQDTAVNMWAMRAFDTQSTTDLGGTVDSILTQTSHAAQPSYMMISGINGTVTNHLPYDLTDCVVIYNGQSQPLPDLARGANAPVSFADAALVNGQPNGMGKPSDLQIPALLGQVDKDDPQGDIRQRMRAALADYARSLGDQNRNMYFSGNGGQAPFNAAYQPAPGEALFLGWSNDPALAGPAPRVDGRSVRENDVTLVIVHLPIKPAPMKL